MYIFIPSSSKISLAWTPYSAVTSLCSACSVDNIQSTFVRAYRPKSAELIEHELRECMNDSTRM